MSKNLTKKALAFGSAFALSAASLVSMAAPAVAAAGDVTISPASGSSWGAFNTDPFTVSADVATSVNPDNLSFRISNPDQNLLYIKIGDVLTTSGNVADGTVTLRGTNALGQTVDMNGTGGGTPTTVDLTIFADGTTAGQGTAGDANEAYGEFLIDFKSLNITTLHIYAIDNVWDGASTLIRVQPTEDTAIAGGTTVLSPAAGNTGPVGATNRLDYGDLDASVTIQAWVETESVADYTTVDSAYASAVETINFYDPKGVAVIPAAERFVDASGNLLLNDVTANANIAATVSFGRSVNLDQMDLTKWSYKIEESNGTAVVAKHAFATGDVVGLSGYTTRDSAGKLYTKLDNAGANFTLNVAKDYVISVTHNDTGAVYFGSVAFVPASNATDADQVEATVTSTTNAIQTNAADTSVQLRTGTKAFTYTAQAKTADATKKEASSIQILAVVKAGAYLSSGGGYTVSGATKTITKKNEAVIATGFTDSKGNYSVTVTSTNAATSEAYTVNFFVLDGATDTWKQLNEGANNALYTATYEAGTATTLTPESTVLSGTDVTAVFSVTDQFSVATNLRGTRAVSVELKSSNGTSLDLDAPVAADGTVSFKFKNFVAAGASDVLTATTYTGSASSPTVLGGALTKTVALYNPAGVAVVQAPATLSTDITYKDFLADGTKATTAKPAPDNGVTLTGTVVDANSVGVPAAPVTISGAGLQFKSGDKYYNGKVDVTASAAGVYSVEVFAQKTNSTGVPITITSAGKTATTTLKTYLPATGVNGNNLKFEIVMPANVVKNTTYAVTVKLTDKWGNPVATTANGGTNALSIQGVGSVQINSVDTATSKNFGKDGTTVVFLRSIKDIAGPGSVTATLAAANYSATSAGTATALAVAEIATDVTTTAWNETLFTNTVSANVEVLESAAGIAKVNVGSFNGKLVVYANGYNGKRISWKVGGRWGSAVASSNTARFDRPTPRRGVTVNVEIYVDGKLELTKSVLTR